MPEEGTRVVLEDSTEVDDEDYFQTLPDDTIFLLLGPGEKSGKNLALIHDVP